MCGCGGSEFVVCVPTISCLDGNNDPSHAAMSESSDAKMCIRYGMSQHQIQGS